VTSLKRFPIPVPEEDTLNGNCYYVGRTIELENKQGSQSGLLGILPALVVKSELDSK